MRTSNQRSAAAPRAVLLLLLGLVQAAAWACSSPPPPPLPAAAEVAPTATPDPHLTDPAALDDVFRKLSAAGLRITTNTATSGRDTEPVKWVSATYRDWPLIIAQFSSTSALLESTRFDPATPPGSGQAPYRIVGLNILVEYGPSVTNSESPPVPDQQRRAAAAELVEVLDLLLGPLQQSAVDPVPLPGSPSKPVASARS
jgi:hypothetical protein